MDAFISSIISSRISCLCRCAHMFQMTFDEDQVQNYLDYGAKVLRKDPPLLRLDGDIMVVGDLHGNVDDLLRIFSINGYPPQKRYLFLGDYVDRGANSIEVVLLLVCLKIKYPSSIYLIRGNHESEKLTSSYGFKTETQRRINKGIYVAFLNVFKQMPLAAVIEDKIFCVHGGISKKLNKISEIEKFEKPAAFSPNSVISDLVWSDPRANVERWAPSDRKVGQYFGWRVVNKFLQENKLQMIVRAHEACIHGYDWPYIDTPKHAHKLLTVFSSTDYGSTFNNGSVLYVPKDTTKYEISILRAGKCGPFSYPQWLGNETAGTPEIDINPDEIPQIPNKEFPPDYL
ncbi:Ser/Thr protein phosphatase, putative [Trichomonas vaginalis G3]|uniref:Serine/threonine-protein phosphatase n=1 Tax=Trichomonas vaginalis (strain ATCC PRA-98 / G3) TaxID=412133 RepID=A2DBL8_TRIV3|nr:phosphoprotein phosphatase protein [Trichomonas vaginalis G3]EAY22221.1 Ser/Thr protein phosphatase, putative [Trichomonas vaginalis G3]KAI5533321.1 phosphoprotein phosphatase protein [Trichomonas vaginalis G3]|eukprot:XP_001583207.1 Ser/Thr protein phosphatase [Trichomonas vaginalis G3]